MKDDDHLEKPDPPEGVGPEEIQPDVARFEAAKSDAERSDVDPQVDATELMLAAYLDGEMTDQQRREFDARLQSEPGLRRRLKQLRQAWDLLDELEACPPSTRFAETTLEMVALDAEVHLKEENEEQRRALRRRRNRIGIGLFVALVAGFALIWFLYPSPDAMLIQHLPLITKLDEYEAAESVAFLEALAQANVFPPTSETVPEATSSKATSETDRHAPASDRSTSSAEEGTLLDQSPPIPGPAKLRRQWVKDLEPIQRVQLEQYWERFEQLRPPQRQKLVDLQRELADAEQSQRLTDVMHQYSEWLRRQLSFTRTGLLALDASDRIAKIQSLRREELNREGLKRWRKKWLEANQEKIKSLLADRRRSSRAQREPPDQPPPPPGHDRPPGQPAPFAGPGRYANRLPITGQEVVILRMLSREDLDDLKQYLSPETARAWDTKSLNAKRFWVGMMIYHMRLEEGSRRRLSAKANHINDEQLADFFENRLTEKQKAELLSMPGEQLHQNLVEQYLRSTSLRVPGNRMPDHLRRGPGRGFGPGRGGNFHGGPPPEDPMPPEPREPAN